MESTVLTWVHAMPWAWSWFCLAFGVLCGAVVASGWRLRLSNDLLGEEQRRHLLETRSEHQQFGVTDLRLRIRLSQHASDLLRAELAHLRNTHQQADQQLQDRWAAEAKLKAEQSELQATITALETELSDWKDRLNSLQTQLDEGLITESQLRRELTAGLSAVCEHANAEMPAVQQLLLDCASEIDPQTPSTEPQKVIGLLAAKVQLLEGQTQYWQERATAIQNTGHTDVSDDQSSNEAEQSAPARPRKARRKRRGQKKLGGLAN